MAQGPPNSRARRSSMPTLDISTRRLGEREREICLSPHVVAEQSTLTSPADGASNPLPTSFSPPDNFPPLNHDDDGPNYSHDIHSSRQNYLGGFTYYHGYSNPLPLSPIDDISSTLPEWPPEYFIGSCVATIDSAPRVIGPSFPTYYVANSIPVLPGVSQPSAVGEIAPGSGLPLQHQLVDSIKTNTAPSGGRLTEHKPIQPAKLKKCLQCGECFETMMQLNRHGKDSKHAAIMCNCGATFSRNADLQRHLGQYQSTAPAFPCRLCTLHRGKHGFWRKDHLSQHRRGYHRITSENTLDEDSQ